MNPSLKVSDICNGVRALLNDMNVQLFTDAALIPQLSIALGELSEIFEENGMPCTRLTSGIITVPTGILNIGGAGGPALPNDLVEINALWERYAGTSVDFLKMNKYDYLPNIVTQTSYLQFYTWQNQIIQFIGATGPIEIKIEYIGNVFPNIVDSNTIIPIINAKTALVFRTAGLAAEFIGENQTRAQSLNGQGGTAVERLTTIGNQANQSIVTRRRPFRGNWKTRQTGW